MSMCDEAILIQAPPPVVWEYLKKQRCHYDTKVTPLESELHYLALQTFKTPLGDAHVNLEINETPYERVDFQLVESSSVRVLSGSWIFTKTATGTKLRMLINDLRTKQPVPRLALKMLISATTKMRLRQIKEMSEK